MFLSTSRSAFSYFSGWYRPGRWLRRGLAGAMASTFLHGDNRAKPRMAKLVTFKARDGTMTFLEPWVGRGLGLSEWEKPAGVRQNGGLRGGATRGRRR